jgi:hypothetical protein
VAVALEVVERLKARLELVGVAMPEKLATQLPEQATLVAVVEELSVKPLIPALVVPVLLS